jgi:hypothetical protein
VALNGVGGTKSGCSWRRGNLDLEVPEFCEEWLGGAIRRLCVFSFAFVLCPLLVLETDELYASRIVIKVIHHDAFALCMCSQSLS